MTPERVRGADRAAVERGQAALRRAALLHPRRPEPPLWRRRSSPPPARSAPTCSAICGRRNGAISTTSSRRPARGQPPYDLTQLLERANYTPERVIRTAEGFFTSLGFAPLPATFWERSMITQPRDREVICHASAWDVDNVEDLRIKMCTRVNADDFVTAHHELGHNFYQRAYNRQPYPLSRQRQ